MSEQSTHYAPAQQPRKHSHNYKGGSIASNGYKLVYVGKGHHLADVRGYAYEHRVEAEKKIGRRLRHGEQVHHKDEDKLNNDQANLVVVAGAAEHRLFHRNLGSNLRLPDEPNELVSCACGCGQRFWKYDECGRPRAYVSGHNPQPASTETAILLLLAGGQLHRTEIVGVLNKTAHSVSVCLSKLRRKGKARPVGGGRWALTTEDSCER